MSINANCHKEIHESILETLTDADVRILVEFEGKNVIIINNRKYYLRLL